MTSPTGNRFSCAAVSGPSGADGGLPSHRIPRAEVDSSAVALEAKVIEWRRHFHQNPELGNRETATAQVVADHLTKLGFEVQTGVAYTGVVGLLKGALPGKVVALRADMDALPVAEEVDVPFASKVRTTYDGFDVGVMHACGHDAHTAILMGVAELLAGMRDRLAGSVKFIFQPAEEGAPEGEEGGAALMIKEGVLQNPRPDAIFGLHVTSMLHAGYLGYRPGPAMASSDVVKIDIKGAQTHGARPWAGVDPIVVASQVVLGLQTIASRQINVTKEPSVLTIGSIHGGVRHNIIPDQVSMTGTVRTYDEGMRSEIHERITRTAEMIAGSAGARACVCIRRQYDVTINDEVLTEAMVPTMRRVAGTGKLVIANKNTGAEDFSCYQKEIPGLFINIGVTFKDRDTVTAPTNHSPRFHVDESGLLLGIRALANLTLDYLDGV